MLLHDLVRASRAVAATRSRTRKVQILADALASAGPEEVPVVAPYLSGRLRQRRTGLGWRSLAQLPEPSERPTLDVLATDAAFERIAGLAGQGSRATRAVAVAELFGRATATEQAWLRGAVTGEVRQGALDALLQEAVAVATGIDKAVVRRAAMLAGSSVPVAIAALRDGETALAGFRLEVGRPVSPMLAASGSDVAAALERVGLPAAVEAKLDGIRVQVHKDGERVLVATRTLEDITARLPEVVAVVRALPVERAVLDGEAVALEEDGRARPFQETASRTASGEGVTVTPYFFDLLLLDDEPLLDLPASQRHDRLAALVPSAYRVPRTVAADATAASAFLAQALDDGHEGVVVKAPGAPYAAGRRGAAWVKVKPVHTLDLVVLAVEEGSGRRRGWLSNIHLGARDPERGGFTMLGKTFKGMTDEMLEWQTSRFRELETSLEGHVVHVRPEQVVEIAFDGVQRSTRYPGGVALRFARVVRYRDDKPAAAADTVDSIRSLLR